MESSPAAAPTGAPSTGRRVAYTHTASAPSTSTPHAAIAKRQPVAAASGTVSEMVSIDPTFSAAV